jgi:hypothetical protein
MPFSLSPLRRVARAIPSRLSVSRYAPDIAMADAAGVHVLVDVCHRSD